MTEDLSGMDRERILAEIGASASLPAEPSLRPPPESARPPTPRAGFLSRETRERLLRHRGQIAAIVIIFVALVWMSVGLAVEEGAPIAIGAAFFGLALLVGVRGLLR